MKHQKLISLFLFGVFLFNYPILSLFDVPSLQFGIPKLYLYLFVVWFVVIGLSAWFVEKRDH